MIFKRYNDQDLVICRIWLHTWFLTVTNGFYGSDWLHASTAYCSGNLSHNVAVTLKYCLFIVCFTLHYYKTLFSISCWGRQRLGTYLLIKAFRKTK